MTLSDNEIKHGRTFEGREPFEAYRACVEWLEGLGFSVGSLERNQPVGVRFERGVMIAKFSRLGRDSWQMHGWIDGEFREGPVKFEATAAGRRVLNKKKEMAG